MDTYRVSNPGSNDPNRNPNPAVVWFDHREYPIPVGGSSIMPENIATLAKEQHPWLQLTPVEAVYTETKAVEHHNCPYPGCNAGFDNYAGFVTHMKLHFATLQAASPAVAPPAVVPVIGATTPGAEPLRGADSDADEGPAVGVPCVAVVDNVSHEASFLGATTNGWLRVLIEDGTEHKVRKSAVTFLP